jgi:hypothetical protein
MPHSLVHFIFKSELASERKFNYRVCAAFFLFSFFLAEGREENRKTDILKLIIGTQGMRNVIQKMDF